MNMIKRTIIAIMILVVLSMIIPQISCIETNKNIRENNSILEAKLQRAGLFEDHYKLIIKNNGPPKDYLWISCRMYYFTLQNIETYFTGKYYPTISVEGTFENGLNEFDVPLPEDDSAGTISFSLYIHYVEGPEQPCYKTKFFHIGNLVFTSNVFEEITIN